MGNVSTFLSDDDYHHIHEETGCKFGSQLDYHTMDCHGETGRMVIIKCM